MLTVIIASYNHEKYIEECLYNASLIKVDNKKIVIIDDGSTDRTPQIVKQFIAAHKLENEIELIEKPNGGLISSLIIAVKIISTPYVYFSASDDIPVSSGIEQLIKQLEKDREASFIIGGAFNLFDNGRKIPTYTKEHNRFFLLDFEQQQKHLYLNYPHPILFQSSVFRTSVIRAVGGWDQDVQLDDYSMFIKLFEYNFERRIKTPFYPETICAIYRHHDSNSYKNTLRQFQMVTQALMKYAPPQYLKEAISNVASSYLLTSLRMGNFASVVAIFKLINKQHLGFVFLSGIRKVINKVFNI
ncbi:MAG: glycosyltransferase family 2 protein [Segetibacter sp.]